LTERIDHHEKPSFTIPPTEAGDGDPGPSNQGQFDTWIPPDNPNPDKRSASTPRQEKGKGVEVEETANRRHHRQVILGVIQTQILVTMTTMTIKEETMAGAEEADVWNATLEDDRFLEIHLPVREAYWASCNNSVHQIDQ